MNDYRPQDDYRSPWYINPLERQTPEQRAADIAGMAEWDAKCASEEGQSAAAEYVARYGADVIAAAGERTYRVCVLRELTDGELRSIWAE